MHTEAQHESLLNRLISINLALMVLIRIMQIPEEPTPAESVENVLLKLSDALDIVLNPDSPNARVGEPYEGIAGP